MSEYRRLISYLYEYEGKEKGKNVGFVKLETRNGQCRMNLSVKKVYVGGNPIGVYLLQAGGGETFLGNLFVRGGNGEFRFTVDVGNVEKTGKGLDTYYGLSIHDIKNSWRSYRTIWEDAAAGMCAEEILPGSSTGKEDEAVSRVIREIEEEIAKEEERKSREEQPVAHAAEVSEEEAPEKPEETVPPNLPEQPEAPDEAEIPAPQSSPESSQISDQPASVPAPVDPEPSAARSPELENPEILKYLQETEDITSDPEKLWEELRKAFPKIQAFEYAQGCEILMIRPQDLGRLPRENWVYGNNSFLLHGYYNFRYIILARLLNRGGAVRYLIGVPGHYYSSEKYMASMFGFPNFVLSKKQPSNDGRFGYWYTDIKIR